MMLMFIASPIKIIYERIVTDVLNTIIILNEMFHLNFLYNI